MVEQFVGALAPAPCDDLAALLDGLIAGCEAGGRPRSSLTYSFRGDLPQAAQSALQACIERISAPAGEGSQTLFAETIALTALGEGDSIPAHADNCMLDAQGRWVPSEYRQRCLSALLYLSESFEGGELVFDAQGLRIQPRKGLLVVFPSDHRHVHRVECVRAGRRHVLSIWFTVHRWHALLAQRVIVRWPR